MSFVGSKQGKLVKCLKQVLFDCLRQVDFLARLVQLLVKLTCPLDMARGESFYNLLLSILLIHFCL